MGLFSTIFGGSKSKSSSTSQSNQMNSSWNQAYPFLQQTYGGQAQTGVQGTDFLSQLLGLKGGDEASRGYDQYKRSAGYGHIMDDGLDKVQGAYGFRGLNRSGAAYKGMEQFRQNTNSQFLNQYLDRLLGLSGQGLSAGQLIGGAGARSYGEGSSTSQSQSTSKSNPGIAQFLGQIAGAAAASDPRLKYDIKPVGTLPVSGYTLYSFKYNGSTKPQLGVMATEVDEEFLGPVYDGYLTVDYGKLGRLEGVQ